MTDALRAAAGRGAWVLGYCSGTFALAYAGLLAGRRATTHWHVADGFRAMFPDVELDPDVLYVAETAVMTSAGTSAAVDLSLQVLREVDGPGDRQRGGPADGGAAAPGRRPGPVRGAADADPDGEHDLADLLAWMAAHLERGS